MAKEECSYCDHPATQEAGPLKVRTCYSCCVAYNRGLGQGRVEERDAMASEAIKHCKDLDSFCGAGERTGWEWTKGAWDNDSYSRRDLFELGEDVGRDSGIAEERARVVAWLKQQTGYLGMGPMLAGAIQSGDHLATPGAGKGDGP